MTAMSGGVESAVDAMDELLADEVVHEPVGKFPDSHPTRGRAEFADWWRRYAQGFAVSRWSIRELIEVEDDRVLARSVLHVEGGESGIAMDSDLFQAYWLRDGRIFRMSDHVTLSGARKVLGLDP
jgi:ketosteroid isomerase-like protein